MQKMKKRKNSINFHKVKTLKGKSDLERKEEYVYTENIKKENKDLERKNFDKNGIIGRLSFIFKSYLLYGTQSINNPLLHSRS
jgi:hypothetical protein